MSKREYLAINLIDGSMTRDGYIAIELLPNVQVIIGLISGHSGKLIASCTRFVGLLQE